jgi:hypothetical protein
MMGKKLFFITLTACSILFSSIAFAQRGTESKFYVGGNLGLMFGTYTVIDISPIVGYKVTERFHVGSGLTYTYYKYTEDGPPGTPSTTYSTSIYGGRLFTRYYVAENLFAHVEDELLSMELPDLGEYYLNHRLVISRRWLNSVLVGGGYGYGFGSDGPALSIMVLFRINNEYEDFYPYQNPIIRIGLGFGL